MEEELEASMELLESRAVELTIEASVLSTLSERSAVPPPDKDVV